MKAMATNLHPVCPCGRLDPKGRPLALDACCGRFLSGAVAAPDAESLMRSRYTAYAVGDDAYLRDTWQAATRPAELETDPRIKWLGLDVRGHRLIDADHAEVTFVARYRLDGRGGRMQERSRFVREGGRWFYVEGEVA